MTSDHSRYVLSHIKMQCLCLGWADQQYLSVSLSLLQPPHIYHNIIPFGCQLAGFLYHAQIYEKLWFWRLLWFSPISLKHNLSKIYLRTDLIQSLSRQYCSDKGGSFKSCFVLDDLWGLQSLILWLFLVELRRACGTSKPWNKAVVCHHALGALSAIWGQEIQESMEKAASSEGAMWQWINLMQLLQRNVKIVNSLAVVSRTCKDL